MDFNLAQVLTDGGAYGIAVGLIIYSIFKDKLYNKTINNHFKHTEMAFDKHSESNVKLAEALTKLSDKVSDCPIKEKYVQQ